MEKFDRERFEKSLKINKIIRYHKDFESVLKTYLELDFYCWDEEAINKRCEKPCDVCTGTK